MLPFYMLGNLAKSPSKDENVAKIGGGGPHQHLATLLKDPSQHVLQIGRKDLKDLYLVGL